MIGVYLTRLCRRMNEDRRMNYTCVRDNWAKKDLQGNKYLNGVQKVWEPHSVLIHYQWTVTWYWNLVEWKHFLYRLMQTDTNVLLLPWLMQLRESNTFNSINCNFMIKGLQIRSARCLCCFMVKVHKEHSSIVKEVALCLYDTHYLTCVIVGNMTLYGQAG